jgi:hypothetical protein
MNAYTMLGVQVLYTYIYKDCGNIGRALQGRLNLSGYQKQSFLLPISPVHFKHTKPAKTIYQKKA